ncbi:MAG: pyrroline-5-carboxylate reductase, partial [Candidatus Omnitrophica bacterium]|nr:pyrroline-5-carboxylate reductase [Candidatus Omnitrophota bacterium]
GNKLTRKQLLISIVAGLNSGAIQKLCPEVQVIRVMPNIPALIGQGMSAFCRGKRVATAYSGTAKKILGAVGKVVEVKEDLMDAITALSGSGPAYFFYLIEALTEAGEKIGIKKKMARELAVQTALGSAGLLAQTGLDPAQLRRKVTSKGGTTQAALNVFEKGELKQLVKKAVVAARNRSRELSK